MLRERLLASRQYVLFLGMNIGTRLKQLREARGLTQAELGDRIGRIQSEIYRWEKSRVRIPADDLPLLAKALAVPIAAFFDEEEAGSDRVAIDWELQALSSQMSDEARQKLIEFLRVNMATS